MIFLLQFILLKHRKYFARWSCCWSLGSQITWDKLSFNRYKWRSSGCFLHAFSSKCNSQEVNIILFWGLAEYGWVRVCNSKNNFIRIYTCRIIYNKFAGVQSKFTRMSRRLHMNSMYNSHKVIWDKYSSTWPHDLIAEWSHELYTHCLIVHVVGSERVMPAQCTYGSYTVHPHTAAQIKIDVMGYLCSGMGAY